MKTTKEINAQAAYRAASVALAATRNAYDRSTAAALDAYGAYTNARVAYRTALDDLALAVFDQDFYDYKTKNKPTQKPN